MRRVLMVAYHFPPLAGSSGIQRSLRFAQQLPKYGWQPSVLTVNSRAYEQTSTDLLDELPPDMEVVRTFAIDTSRHLALMGRYPGWMARPDRWISWVASAVPAGLALIRQQRPAAIWSTYPIPTAHLIANLLAHFSGLPWIADFRDPMAHEGYPQDPATWRSYLNIERRVFRRARRMVFTTPGAVRLYGARYPECASRIHLIENGYDEEAFARAEFGDNTQPLNPGKLTILHSGIVYPEWRNPVAMFAALQQLLACGQLNCDTLRLRFRAPVHEQWISRLADAYGLQDIVEILPPIPYIEALREMLAADGLLALQSRECNDQIPAKAYEYLRAGKPILGLVDSHSDTALLLRSAGMGPICALESAEEISGALLAMIQTLSAQDAPHINNGLMRSASRVARTSRLAELLDDVAVEAA